MFFLIVLISSSRSYTAFALWVESASTVRRSPLVRRDYGTF